MSVTYRIAGLDDLPALAGLRWEMEVERKHTTTDLDAYTQAFADALREDVARGSTVSWVAEEDGEPVACVTLVWWNLAPNFENAHRKRGFVSNVFTRPAYRRQGISRALMSTLIAWAQVHGVLRLILWTSDKGRPLYESLGFEPCRGLEIDL